MPAHLLVVPVLTVVLATLTCGCGGGAEADQSPRSAPEDTSPATLITALGNNSFRVGAYAIDHVFRFARDAPSSLADVEAKLGHGNHCSGTGGSAKVRWRRSGLSGDFETLGMYSDANGDPIVDGTASGCDYRDQILVSSLTATGPHWHTREGLRIRDPQQRMLTLYPRAVQDGPDWWLHTYKSPFGGGTEPDMLARVRQGRVFSITVVIGAQGD